MGGQSEYDVINMSEFKSKIKKVRFVCVSCYSLVGFSILPEPLM